MQIYLPIAEVSLDIYMLMGVGITVGILSGMFGVGGGFLMTPLLIFAGVPAPVAVASEANQIAGSSVAGTLAHWRRNSVDFKMGGVLAAGGALGTIIGVGVFTWLKTQGQIDLIIKLSYVILLGVIGCLIGAESLRTAYARFKGKSIRLRHRAQHNWLHGLPMRMRFRKSKLYISFVPPALIGMVSGFLAAIMGVGGGFLLVPAMIYLLHMPTNVVIGTSLFQIIFVTAFAAFAHAVTNHSVDIVLVFLLLIGASIGVHIGARIGDKLRAEHLRGLLAALVLIVAGQMIYNLIATPDELFSLEFLTSKSAR